MIFLLQERLNLIRVSKEIPIRICVTGTRGKSSVTRLIAACLRESGMSILAKTTGSRPCLIFPDGEEKEIQRFGNPSILEGKKVLKLAAKSKVHAVVMEMMSIRPESHYSESIQMIKPHILVVTNIRKDHLAEMGPRKEDIARGFTSAFTKKSSVFFPTEESYPVFREKAEKVQAKMISVSSNEMGEDEVWKTALPSNEFEQNLRLAAAVAKFLEIDQETVKHGLSNAQTDFGSLKIWKIESGSPSKIWYSVSAFAANDPESTQMVLNKLKKKGLFENRRKIGLFNLRLDRGKRTIQWLETLREGEFFPFDGLVFIGEHARAVKARLNRFTKTEIFVYKTNRPEELMAQLFHLGGAETVLVGMGNMRGMGQLLVDYWAQSGRRHDL